MTELSGRPSDRATAVPAPPGLPPARTVRLPGRGEAFLRTDEEGRGRTDVLLVHGWTVTADTTFASAYAPLADRYRLIAPDLRGHGRGPRARGRLRLEDLADDLAATLDALELDQVVVVGYSLGGAVAQLLWRRHPGRVAGLVLCSTALDFRSGPVGDLWYRGQGWLAPAARAWPGPARTRLQRAVHGKVTDGVHAEWYRQELVRSDPAGLLQVGAALGRFCSSDWISEVDVPTAVLVTTEDRTVPPHRQRDLAAAIPGARVYEVDGPHNAVATRAEEWVPALRDALDALTRQPTAVPVDPGGTADPG